MTGGGANSADTNPAVGEQPVRVILEYHRWLISSRCGLADTKKCAIQLTLQDFLQQMRNQCCAACNDQESRSYGFLCQTLVLLNSTISRDDSVVSCFPQGTLRTSSGLVTIPDFVNVLFSFDEQIPRAGLVLNWWEAKPFPVGNPIIAFENEFKLCFAQVKAQALAVFDQSPQIKCVRAILSCGTRFTLLEFRRPSIDPIPPLFDWVKREQVSLRDDVVGDRAGLRALAPKYAVAKAMLQSLSPEARAKAKGKAAKRAFDRKRDALLSGLAACDECLEDPYLPYIYYFAEPMFTLTNPDAGDSYDLYRSISGMTVQFLHALRIFSTPHDTSLAVTFKFRHSFFDPPAYVHEREIMPSNPLTMVRSRTLIYSI